MAQRGKTKGRARVRDRAALALIDRLAFERLLAEFASRFADVPVGAVTAEIESALSRLVHFFGYDRCTYGEFGADGSLDVMCSAAAGRVAPYPRGPYGNERSWYLGELRAGRPVVLPALPKGLPPHARAEAEHVKTSGLRSLLASPLRIRGRTTGVVAACRKAGGMLAQILAVLALVPARGFVSVIILVPTTAVLALVAWYGKETRGRDLRDLDVDGHTFSATGV